MPPNPPDTPEPAPPAPDVPAVVAPASAQAPAPPPVDPDSPLGVGGALLAFLTGFFAAQVVGTVGIGIVLLVGLTAGWLPPPTADPAWVMELFTHPAVMLTAAFASSATFAFTAWAACRLAKRRPRTALGLTRPPLGAVLASIVGVAAIGILVDELVTVFRQILPSLTFGVLEAFGDVARAEGWVVRPLVFLCMTVVPGFSEELFFRGLLQRSFVARLGAPIGIALAAFTFGFVHLDPPQALGAMLTGGFLGWIAWRSRSLWPAIVAHTTNNALAWFGANFEPLHDMSERQEHMPAWVVALAGVVTALSILGVALSTRRATAT